MKIKKGISVIVTVFNKEKFIEKTILCILKQMKKNYLLIIVNDGSTDNTWVLIKGLKKKFKGKLKAFQFDRKSKFRQLFYYVFPI